MVLVGIALCDVDTTEDIAVELDDLLLTETIVPLVLPLHNYVERSRVVSVIRSSDRLAERNEVAVRL